MSDLVQRDTDSVNFQNRADFAVLQRFGRWFTLLAYHTYILYLYFLVTARCFLNSVI